MIWMCLLATEGLEVNMLGFDLHREQKLRDAKMFVAESPMEV